MIENYAYGDLFLRNDVKKEIMITDGYISKAGGSFVYHDYTYLLKNDDLKSVPKIYEMLTDENDLDFGRCNSNYIEFSIAADVTSLIGKKCHVYMWLDDNIDTLLEIGTYYVTSDKATADRNYRNVVAYDKLNEMSKADVTAWYESLFPNASSIISVASFRASFCQHFGVIDSTDATRMVNDAVTFGKTISPGDSGIIDGNTILRAFCSINGGFGNIDRDGKFRCICLPQSLIGLYPAIDLYPAEDLYPREDVTHLISSSYYIPPLAYEDYYTESITKVQIRQDDDDIGVTVGTEGNGYVLEGNFILFGKGAAELGEIATRLLGRIKGLSYMPYEVRAFGNPIFEVGDPVRFRTGNVRVNSYILKRTLTGTIALEDQYQSVGNQYRSDSVDDISTSITKLKNKTAKITKNVEEVSAELTEQLDDEVAGSYAWQTSQQIGLKVSKGDVSSQISVESGQVTIQSNRLVVESSKFTLLANGNATFGGVVEAATITACDILGSYIISNGYESYAELNNGQVLVKPSQASSSWVAITTSYDARVSGYVPSVQVIDVSNGNTIIEGGYISVGLYVKLYGNDITIAGQSVLTTGSTISSSQLPSDVLTTSSTISASQLPNTINVGILSNSHGNNRILFDAGSSSYNIVLNGSVNIGNGSSNTIRIKGRDVKWQSVTIDGSSYYILVEA